MQQKVREKFLSVGPVSTKQNPSDLGTKRLNRDRMLYLMFLCKVYDLSTSQYVGSEVNDRLEEQTMTSKGIKLFTLAGMNNHDAKALMRVMLISALSLTPATASPAEETNGGGWKLFRLLLCGDRHHFVHHIGIHSCAQERTSRAARRENSV